MPVPVPIVNSLPWWVPKDKNNDIHQDITVVGTCVVIGVAAGVAIVSCCGTAAAGGGAGATGECVILKIVIETVIKPAA